MSISAVSSFGPAPSAPVSALQPATQKPVAPAMAPAPAPVTDADGDHDGSAVGKIVDVRA